MKAHTVSLGLVLASATFASQARAAILADPGFETPLVSNGSGVGKWEPFSNGGGNQTITSTLNPRSGTSHMRLELVAPTSFAGSFQDVPVIAGGEITLSGWHRLDSGNPGGTELRIEFRNAGGEISRTPNLVPPITSDYTEFSLSETVPGGADTARLVYAIQSFGAPAPQVVDVDDIAVSGSGVVPEPSSSLLTGLAIIGLALRRRR